MEGGSEGGGREESAASFPREARKLMHTVNPNLISRRNNEKKERSDIHQPFAPSAWGLRSGSMV